jgi:hypothetical protein
MYVYFQAYEREAESTQPLGVFLSFFRGQEKVYEIPFTVTEGLDPKSKALPVKLSVPLTSLSDGDYVCQITVIDPTASKVAFWQSPVKMVP